MKKLMKCLLILFCLGVLNLQAQEGGLTQFQSKNGHDVLPSIGDWSIGVNANPFLDYAGKFLSVAGSVAPAPLFFNDLNLQGKWFKAEGMTCRGKLRIGLNSITTKTLEPNATNPAEMVENKISTTSSNWVFGGGLEWQRGHKRVIGFYGADALIGITGGSTATYTYGNPSTATSHRVTEDKKGSTFSFGVRPFIGVNYFFAPKMSLGFEWGWHIMMASTGDDVKKFEASTGLPSDSKTPNGSTFDLDNEIDAMLMLSFYF